MSGLSSPVSRSIPLKPEVQEATLARELAKLVMESLRRNREMPTAERTYAISNYPFSLSALSSSKIPGHTNPESPKFAYKWNKAVTILRSKATIMPHRTQDQRPEFIVPTSISLKADFDQELA